VGVLSLPIFLSDLTDAAAQWYATYGSTNRVQQNMEKFARLRPNGLPPFTSGAPVVA
jgi:hypothetical protein